MHARLILCGLWIAASLIQAAAQPKRLYPIDEGEQDPSFRAFREKLLAAVREQDRDFILGVLDPNIHNGSGSQAGSEEFLRQWQLDQPDSRLWDTLSAILSLGGSFVNDGEGTVFCAPYVYPEFPPELNPMEGYAIIVGRGVRMRGRPEPSAPVMALLSYDIVKVDREQPEPIDPGSAEPPLVKIATLGGTKGYVVGKYLRSPLDYRACFRKEGEKWILETLAAGD